VEVKFNTYTSISDISRVLCEVGAPSSDRSARRNERRGPTEQTAEETKQEEPEDTSGSGSSPYGLDKE
jgi:hypothetical protein